jgi:mutator protein MutT
MESRQSCAPSAASASKLRWRARRFVFQTPELVHKLPPMHPPTRRIDAAIAIVSRLGKVLVCQRKEDDELGGYWEFPGGKQEAGETLEQCLHRELDEELAIRARPIARLAVIEHDYPHVSIRLHPFVCVHESGDIEHRECQASEWIDPPRLRDYRFPPANESLIEEAIAYFASGDASRH